MPYTKPLIPQPYARMRRLLLGYELDGPKLAAILGCSPPTARDRIQHPEKLTLGDLDKLRRFGHIPLEELQDAMRGGHQ